GSAAARRKRRGRNRLRNRLGRCRLSICGGPARGQKKPETEGDRQGQEAPAPRAEQRSDGRGIRAGGDGRSVEGVANMSEVMEPMVHEDRLPGHESELEPKPDWRPRYPGSSRLKDKVALITGADSGIGRAVAALFAREGADVAILYLCEHDDAAKTKQIVDKEGRRAITIAGDIGDKQVCELAVRKTVDQLGRLDILVNNAGEQHSDKNIRDITEEQLRRTFQTNVFGMFYLTQAALPHLQEGSAIINCTSETMYAGSKH